MLKQWLKEVPSPTWGKLSDAIKEIEAEINITPETDENIQLAADHLCKSYRESRHSVSANEWPPYQPEHYTTLALICVDKDTSTEVISVVKELTKKGKIEEKNENVLKYHDDGISYQSKSVSEIFLNNLPTGQRNLILIEGAPGIGKTVLSKEIAFQWANFTLLNNKRLLFLLFLRDPKLKDVSSLEKLMAHVFKAKVFNSLSEYLLKTEGKDITIILDGYDEMSEEHRQNSFIADIVNGSVLPECCLVITSRPTASAHLHMKAHCRVEILGFTEKDRLDYIHHALQGEDDKIEMVKSYLQSHSTINALCYIPLNMTILLSLFEETPSETNINKLPETQTEMYEKFIKVTITRFLKKTSNVNVKFSSAAKYSDLSEPHNKVFVELSKLAYDALVQDEIIFTIDKIIEACPHLTMNSDNWNGLGLLKAVQHHSDSVSFHFLHFSVQEYMAAYYITLQPDKEQLKLIRNTFWNIHFFNTWIMYVGITHGESFAWKHLLSGNWFQLSTRLFKTSNISKKFLHNKIKCLHLFQCSLEGSSESIEQLAKSIFQDRTIDLSNQTLQPKDINILGFFLLRSINKHWKKIDLSRCNLRDIGCNALCKMFMDKSNREILKVDEVDFSYNHLQLHTIIKILDVFKSWGTEEVIIYGNASYTNSEELEYFEELILNFDITSKKYFHSISFGQSLFGNKATQNNISNQLSKSTQFTGLYLNECVWEDNSSLNQAFIALIKKQKLCKVHIVGKMNRFCIKGIAEALNQAVSVFIYDNTLADTEVDKIRNILLSKGGISEVVLVIGQNKIIGKLHTVTLNTILSSLEIYHLFSNIKNLCSNPSQPLENYFKLKQHFSYDIKDLYDLFILLQNNSMQCQVSICLAKYNILVAHKCTCEDITKILYHYPGLIKFMYISYCDFYKNSEFNVLIDSISKQGLLLDCYILNSSLETDLVQSIFSRLKREADEKKKFYPWQRNTLRTLIHSSHPSCKITTDMLSIDYLEEDNYTEDISVTFLTKDTIAGYNITNELFLISLQLSQQLQSQVTSWKFWHCYLTSEMLQLINNVRDVETNSLSELGFTCCNIIGDNKSSFLKNTQCFTSLTTFDISSFNEFHKIVKDTASFLLHNKQLKEINISDLDLDKENFRTLALSLKHSNLTKLNISSVGEVSDEDIAAVLSNNIKMKEIDLSGLKIKDFSDIAKSMKNFLHLEKLNISNNSITVDIIGDILSHNNKLEHLSLSNLSLHLEDFMIISPKMKNLTTLKSLDISKNDGHNNYNSIASKHGSKTTIKTTNKYSKSDSVAAIFLHNLELEELNLSKLCLNSEDFITIATAMNTMSNLRKLDISNNSDIGDDAIGAIITLLHHNTNLEMLDMADISLQKSNSVIKVAKVLQKKSSLTKISIGSHCLKISYAAGAIAAVSLHNNKLREIIFQGYSINHKISENLTRLVLERIDYDISEKASIIAALLSNNTTLEEFRLVDCGFFADDLVRVCKNMKNIKTLKSFDISSCVYNIGEAANGIAEVLANNEQLTAIKLVGCNLGPVGGIKVFGQMKNLSKLLSLNISINEGTFEEPTYNYDHNQIAELLSQISHLTTKPAEHIAAQCLSSVLDSNPKLQDLEISNLYLKSDEAVVIFKGMKNLKNLIQLKISQFEIINCNDALKINDAVKILASVLSYNLSLQRLDLSSCLLQYVEYSTCTLLQNEDATDIFSAMRNHSCLTFLNINNICVKLSHTAVQCLASVLECNTKLQYLNMGNLHMNSEDTIVILTSMKNHTNLLKLNMCHSVITNDGAKILAHVLSCNISLQILELSSCLLQNNGAIDILNAIKDRPCLTHLDIDDNNIGVIAAHVLTVMLHTNSKLKCRADSSYRLKMNERRYYK